jgi:hypothetical protein
VSQSHNGIAPAAAVTFDAPAEVKDGRSLRMTAVAKIEVDIFSGQQNPVFEIRGGQAQHLSDLIEGKRQRINGVHLNGGLGFRGFLVRLDGSSMEAYRVLGDTLFKGSDAFADPDKEVEDFILSLLPLSVKKLVRPISDTQ